MPCKELVKQKISEEQDCVVPPSVIEGLVSD